tara:strand:- start:891 stop:1502 length:612 start_codon:yes stop_codon:yes gene_type:complete
MRDPYGFIMRKVTINRDTSETQIVIDLNLDGSGKTDFDTGLPFLEHMLDQIGRHGMIDLSIKAKGDLHIDDHHTIEDIGISLGEALNKAVGDKKGIRRYGHSYVPLDEALSRVVLDFSGRPGLHMKVEFVKEEVGGIDVNMFEHFFQSLCNHAFLTLHIENFSGENTHHQIETIFKAFGRSLRMALEIDSKLEGDIPSTKGAL